MQSAAFTFRMGRDSQPPISTMGTYAMPEYLHSADEESSSSDDCSSSSSSQHDSTPSEPVDASFHAHLKLLEISNANDEASEIETAPIFTNSARIETQSNRYGSQSPFGQYGLLAGDVDRGSTHKGGQDPRLFYNVAAPSSTFICGSQGSGKSHSLSCMLENCLVPSVASVLPRPPTGIVFHYDSFVSDTGGSPCEAANLSTSPNVKVRVLCPPTNFGHIKRLYSKLQHVTVEELRIKETDLNTKRMLEMMAISSVRGGMPLYLNVVTRILRDLRIHQQRIHRPFSYGKFREELLKEELTEAQWNPLKQRLDTLESFMVSNEAKMHSNSLPSHFSGKGSTLQTSSAARGNDWTPKAGQLTIVDLSCPCVTAESACSMFNICLSFFLEQHSKIGRVVALDEAHKYMTDSAECQTLTEALLATIRLQRHLGARIIISTQEPTISPKLLDLCTVTIVHRFTSPDWLDTLKKHLAGASAFSTSADTPDGSDEDVESYEGVHALTLDGADLAKDLFSKIVALRTGEALIFAPSAIIGLRSTGQLSKRKEHVRLGNGVLKVRVRKRVTRDGGRSIMAN